MNAFVTTATKKDFAIIRARAIAADMNDVADKLEQDGEDKDMISKVRRKAEEVLIEAGDVPEKLKFEHACPRCGGTGIVNRFRHVEGGRCFDCGGSGKKS